MNLAQVTNKQTLDRWSSLFQYFFIIIFIFFGRGVLFEILCSFLG